MNQIVDEIIKWFSDNNISHAVVGYSGGIDSSTTIALLRKARIECTLVQVNASNQKYSSNYNIKDFAAKFNCDYREFNISLELDTNEGKEAALPILRNAYFYGVCAELRYKNINCIVCSSTNFDEASYLGFWGKASDGAQDFYPISHLHKSEVYALAKELNVPQEIIDAVPSGDLQWSGDLNDYIMIGATYDQIEFVVRSIYQHSSVKKSRCSDILVMNLIQNTVDNPKVFVNNIVRNSHKYKQSFPGVHLNDKLEHFREHAYFKILNAAKLIKEKLDYSIEFSCS